MAMGNRTKRIAESFIRNLTGANAAEIQEYADGIGLNQEFHDRIEENPCIVGRRDSS